MPYLRFKGFDEEGLRRALPVFVEEFSRVAAVPREIVKVELLNITPISATPCSLEIFMFPRSQEKHDAIAATMHDLLNHFGCRDVHIFFVLLTPSLYYKEGKPLQDISWLPDHSPHKIGVHEQLEKNAKQVEKQFAAMIPAQD